MSTYSELKTLVATALGRNDADAQLVIAVAINYAMIMAGLTFEPPELLKTLDITMGGGFDKVYFPYLVTDVDLDTGEFEGMWEVDENGDLMPIEGNTLSTRLLDIIKIYNKTDNFKMDFIPYERWDILVPSDITAVKYWSLFGNTLFVKATPLTNRILTVSYSTYPKTLETDDETLEFNYHDSYILSTATSIVFAAFEETDSAAMWSKIASFTGDPNALGQKARAVIEGQRRSLESALGQVRGE